MSYSLIRWQIALLLLLAAGCGLADPGQQDACSLHLIKGEIPQLGTLRGAINRYPTFSIEVDGKGKVVNVRVIKGTGMPSADAKLKSALKKWEYNPQPKCPNRETTASVTIDF